MTVEQALKARAERGAARGADTLLLQARATAGEQVPFAYHEPPSPNSTGRALLVAAAVAVVVIGTAIGLRNLTNGNAEPIETRPVAERPSASDQLDGERVDHGEPESSAPGFEAANGHHVPLIALDDPTFRITGGYESAGLNPMDRDPVDDELSAFYDPDLGFDGPYIVIRPTSQRWQIEAGTPTTIDGVPALTAAENLATGIQLNTEDGDYLLVGFNLSADQLKKVATGLRNGNVTDHLPAGVQPIQSGVPEPEDRTVSAEYGFQLDDNHGDILITKGGFHHFQSEVLERWTDPSVTSVRNASVAGRNALLYENGRQGVLWWADGFTIQLRINQDSSIRLDELLPQLGAVEPSKWETITPDTWVPTSGLQTVVEQTVGDTPLVAGTTVASLTTGLTPNDPEVLAATVAGRVACGWIGQWVEATASGDMVRVEDAESAMNQWSKRLTERHPGTAWTENFILFAEAISGKAEVPAGSPLDVRKSYRDSFGCQ